MKEPVKASEVEVPGDKAEAERAQVRQQAINRRIAISRVRAEMRRDGRETLFPELDYGLRTSPPPPRTEPGTEEREVQ